MPRGMYKRTPENTHTNWDYDRTNCKPKRKPTYEYTFAKAIKQAEEAQADVYAAKILKTKVNMMNGIKNAENQKLNNVRPADVYRKLEIIHTQLQKRLINEAEEYLASNPRVDTETAAGAKQRDTQNKNKRELRESIALMKSVRELMVNNVKDEDERLARKEDKKTHDHSNKMIEKYTIKTNLLINK